MPQVPPPRKGNEALRKQTTIDFPYATAYVPPPQPHIRTHHHPLSNKEANTCVVPISVASKRCSHPRRASRKCSRSKNDSSHGSTACRNSPVIGHSRCGSLKLHSVVRGASSAQYSCVLGGSGSGGGVRGGNITDTGEAPFRPG
jgi:hypothetical protein